MKSVTWLHRDVGEGTFGVRCDKSRISRDDPILDGENGFQETRNSGRRLRVSNVAFDLRFIISSFDQNCVKEGRTEPIINGVSEDLVDEKTDATPFTSVGSPACVPVP
jgi:hypothetical protein